MTKIIYATQQVRVLHGQGWPPAGIELRGLGVVTSAAVCTQRACAE